MELSVPSRGETSQYNTKALQQGPAGDAQEKKGAQVAGAQWMRGRDNQDEAREVSKGPIPQSLVGGWRRLDFILGGMGSHY